MSRLAQLMTAMLFLITLVGPPIATGPHHAAQDQEPPMKLVGQKLLFRYQSGLQVIGHYRTPTEVSWEALSGPAKGSKGTETASTAEVAPNVFFVSWVEKSGTTVSQVIDLNRLLVTAFVTFDMPRGRQSMFDKGTVNQQQ